MSYCLKFKTAIARRKSDISENMRNTFLVVTVLIITATYTASVNPPKRQRENAGVDTDAPSPSPSASAGPLFWGIDLTDVYSLFWLYNTLTFWASVWLTAFLLPSRSICLFILITLFLFGSCYMLLTVAISTNIGNYFIMVFSKADQDSWYYSISIMNYIFAVVYGLRLDWPLCLLEACKDQTKAPLPCITFFLSFYSFFYTFPSCAVFRGLVAYH